VRAPACVLLLAAVAALDAAAASGPPAARLDVVAEDRAGRTIEKLTADDFEVIENGVRKEIAAVTFVKGDGAVPAGEAAASIDSLADEQAEAAKEGTRIFAVFLDEYHVAAGEGAALTRRLLLDFLERTLGPRDLVLVVKPLDSLLTLRATRDLAAVRLAIEQFEGRKDSYEPRSALEASITAGDRGRADAIRVQVVTSALNAIAAHLSRLSTSRKALIVVTEGFEAPARRRGEGALPTIDSVIRSANRGAVSIFTLDPRALAAQPLAGVPRVATTSAGDSAHDKPNVLTTLASETDGEAMLTAAAMKPAFDRLVRDLSGHYILTLAGPDAGDGGRFHPVEVRVRRPNVLLRARRGYWSATPADLFRSSETARPATPALPPLLPRRASPIIRPWFGVTRDAAGSSQVSFVWEAAERVPGERGRSVAPARIRFRAFAPDGRIIYEGAARPAGAPLGPPDTPRQIVFSAPAGRIRVEMAIEDATTRVIDTDVRDVLVRALAGPVALGTPQVLRSRSAREHTLLGGSPAAVPVATRAFSRTERLWVRIAAYGTDGEPELSARLLSTVGGVMRALTIESTAIADIHQVDVPLAGLAVGEYSVQFSATAGGRIVSEVVTFRVTP
jgi:VWFA-related protein